MKKTLFVLAVVILAVLSSVYAQQDCYEEEYEEGGAGIVCEPHNDVPEFGTIGAAFALSGIGAYMYRKRK